VDELEELASKYSITAMPTFICLKGSQKVGMMKGADPSGLRDFVNKYGT
jgi:thioredoxin 1